MGGVKNAKSTATQQLPDYLQKAYTGIVGNAQQTASQPYTPYTGGFTQDQQTAFGRIGALANPNNANVQGATSALQSVGQPTYQTVGNYMSPYLQNVLSAATANMQEQNAQQQQGVIGNAISKGALGGNRVGVAQSELARQQGLANNQAISDILNQGYGTALGAAQADRQTGLGVASAYSNLNQQQLGAAQAQLGAGTQQQQFDYSQYLNKQAFPYMQNSYLASIVGGLAPSAGGTTTQTTPQGNIFSQLAGLGLGVAGLFANGGRVGLAGGGVPMPYGASPDFPSYVMGGQPYANDNATFGSYVPANMNLGLGAKQFPGIQMPDNDDTEFNPTAGMKKGAQNIKGWLTPKADASKVRMPGLYGFGGRVGLAGGGIPYLMPYGNAAYDTSVDDMYGGIFDRPLASAIPPVPVAPKAADTIDTVNALNGDRLGLDVNTTLPPRGEDQTYKPPGFGPADPTGFDVAPPEFAQRFDTASVAGDPTGPGLVPQGITQGGPFTTTPDPRYSQNIGEAFSSFGNGKGFNVAPDVRQGLLAAGLGMMASKSPFALQGIGEGGLEGINAWQNYNDMQRENAKARNEISTGQAGTAQTTRQVDQAAALLFQTLHGAAAGTGLTTMQTLTSQYDMEGTMAGLIIKDKAHPEQSYTIPWNALSQDVVQKYAPPEMGGQGGGTEAKAAVEPKGGKEGYRVNPPDALQPTPLGFTNSDTLKAQTGQALERAAGTYSAANDMTTQLDMMDNAVANLPTSGVLAQGWGAGERADAVKAINTLMTMVGSDKQIDPNAVANIEELKKITTNFGFNLSRVTGSDVAASVVNQAISAVPSVDNTPQGFRAVTASIRAGINRQKDYYEALQNWIVKTNGSMIGQLDGKPVSFDEYFNKVAPPSKYADAALLSAAVVPKTQADIDGAPSGTLFNIDGHLMTKP